VLTVLWCSFTASRCRGTKGERVRELIEGRGCKLQYLPPYSPDFNPIEQAFSKIKGFLRQIDARTREALLEAIGGTRYGHC